MLGLTVRLSFANEMWVEVMCTTSQQKISHVIMVQSSLLFLHVQLKTLNGHHQINSEISAERKIAMILVRS